MITLKPEELQQRVYGAFMEGTAFWCAAVIASISVGLSKGGLPVVAMMSVPILSLVIQPFPAMRTRLSLQLAPSPSVKSPPQRSVAEHSRR